MAKPTSSRTMSAELRGLADSSSDDELMLPLAERMRRHNDAIMPPVAAAKTPRGVPPAATDLQYELVSAEQPPRRYPLKRASTLSAKALSAKNRGEGEIWIGRSEAECDVVIFDEIQKLNVSRVHAVLQRQSTGRPGEAEWVLTDRASTNGVFVNGTRVASAVLRVGDLLTVGCGGKVAMGATLPSLKPRQSAAFLLTLAVASPTGADLESTVTSMVDLTEDQEPELPARLGGGVNKTRSRSSSRRGAAAQSLDETAMVDLSDVPDAGGSAAGGGREGARQLTSASSRRLKKQASGAAGDDIDLTSEMAPSPARPARKGLGKVPNRAKLNKTVSFGVAPAAAAAAATGGEAKRVQPPPALKKQPPAKRQNLMKRSGTRFRLQKATADSSIPSSYAACRLALDDEPRRRLGRRADRRHARAITEDEEGTFGKALPIRSLSAVDAAAFREQMVQRFELAGTRYPSRLQDEAMYLDQSHFAACSFAGFLQMLSLNGVEDALDELVPAGSRQPSKRWGWWCANWCAT